MHAETVQRTFSASTALRFLVGSTAGSSSSTPGILYAARCCSASASSIYIVQKAEMLGSRHGRCDCSSWIHAGRSPSIGLELRTGNFTVSCIPWEPISTICLVHFDLFDLYDQISLFPYLLFPFSGSAPPTRRKVSLESRAPQVPAFSVRRSGGGNDISRLNVHKRRQVSDATHSQD
jgi:hypothetical protein